MGGHDPSFDVIFQLPVGAVFLDSVQFHFVLKIDIAEQMQHFAHHGVDAGRARAIIVIKFFVIVLLQMGHGSSLIDGASPTGAVEAIFTAKASP
jgi:hypothetical protein